VSLSIAATSKIKYFRTEMVRLVYSKPNTSRSKTREKQVNGKIRRNPCQSKLQKAEWALSVTSQSKLTRDRINIEDPPPELSPSLSPNCSLLPTSNYGVAKDNEAAQESISLDATPAGK
jgi:hypothetical protein